MEGAEHWTRFSAVQFKPGRIAAGASQHEREPATPKAAPNKKEQHAT